MLFLVIRGIEQDTIFDDAFFACDPFLALEELDFPKHVAFLEEEKDHIVSEYMVLTGEAAV
ncbi:hypothetical protein [Methylobacterium persicinum]|uniref:DUF1330 domain-containing protein n=1 Tax=Methylobacterium persicinum TaxID=374426 RepID=A0ABU0HMU4_9HYPH|nr:hypothetical protein [Methylobacterium persicinum]MDQ0443005.1 hypothetical protein [Methylobacterium persicinum]